MCNRIIVATFIIVLFLSSCANKSQYSNLGILKGTIGIYEGNCMPSPGVAPCKPRPISTTILITKPNKNFEIQSLVDSLLTNEKGEFKLNLPSGAYSLFIRDGKEIVCDGYKCEKECYCTPFQVMVDSVTIITANINHASW